MPVNPAAALAIQVAKGILSMGWAFWSVDHVKQSHSGGPPPLTIKMSWPGVVNCQPECSQLGSIWDGLQKSWGKLRLTPLAIDRPPLQGYRILVQRQLAS